MNITVDTDCTGILQFQPVYNDWNVKILVISLM